MVVVIIIKENDIDNDKNKTDRHCDMAKNMNL